MSFNDCFPIIIQQAVIWGDMDAFEHVNNTVYFRYFEDARLAYFEKIGVMEHKAETGVGPILAATDCQFKAPLSYPDTISIGASIEEIGEKKFNMRYAVRSHDLDKVVAEGQGLVVYYDYNAGKSCAVPDTIVTAIKSLQKAL